MKRRSTKLARARRVLAAALLACAPLGAGCASLAGREPLEVQLASITPLPSTAFEHRLRVDLRLRNPNDRAYEIDGLRFVLDVNGRRLASGVSSERATLPRLGEVVVPVTTTTSLLDVVNQIVAFAGQPQPRFAYALRGKLFLAGIWGSIDFEREGSDRDLLRLRAAQAPRPAAASAPHGSR
ncbi:MAG: water stress/hypersensitive response domain-containing protein [Proteobacteria bacterium]|nr:MAG: water stress/hypersensitive response domain-containing protein [Pseudomonadota bacterium]